MKQERNEIFEFLCKLLIKKQIENLKMELVRRYDKQLFTTLFNVTNRIHVEKISVCLHFSRDDNIIFKKSICKAFHEQIRCLETNNMISNNVSYFIYIHDLTLNFCETLSVFTTRQL